MQQTVVEGHSGLRDVDGNPLYCLDSESRLIPRPPMDEESIQAWERIPGTMSVSVGGASGYRFCRRDLILWANGEFREALTVGQMHGIIEFFAHHLLMSENRAYYAKKDAEDAGDGGE